MMDETFRFSYMAVADDGTGHPCIMARDLNTGAFAIVARMTDVVYADRHAAVLCACVNQNNANQRGVA